MTETEIRAGQIWEYRGNIRFQVSLISTDNEGHPLISLQRLSSIREQDYTYDPEVMKLPNWKLVKDVDFCLYCKTPIVDDYICANCLNEV